MFTVVKTSILLRGGRIAVPGTILSASDFKGSEKQLAILIQEGVLVRGKAELPNGGLDIERANGEHLPALPTEEDRNGQRVLSKRFALNAPNTGKAEQKLKQIKALQEAKAKKVEKTVSGASKAQLLTAEERAALLDSVEGQELAPEEMKALGLIR